jgi:flagellar hook assembly protein FlgD
LTWTWKVNGVIEKGPGSTAADSAFTRNFSDAHGTAKVVTAVFADPSGLKDSTTWNFTITPVEEHVAVPTEFNLGQNYPNPFNPTTTISFSLPKEAPVTFEIYNMLGVKIRTLMAGQTKSAGLYTVAWDGRNDAGVSMSSGVYLYRINAGSFLASKKMTLLK